MSQKLSDTGLTLSASPDNEIRQTSPKKKFRPANIWSPLAICIGVLISLVVAFYTTNAYAQTTPTITLSVPAMTKFAEGEGNTTVTVTATLSVAPSSETVIDLTLGGTAKGTDYTVVQLPDITIEAEQTVGEADMILNPVDDNFFEGEETISIGGTVASFKVTQVDTPLVDNETAPNLQLSYERLGPKLYQFREGESIELKVKASLYSDNQDETAKVAVFEEDKDIRLEIKGKEGQIAADAADIDYETDPPWTLTIPEGMVEAELPTVKFTVVDDEVSEDTEYGHLHGTIVGTNITAEPVRFIWIAESDLPLLLGIRCYPATAFVEDSFECWPAVGGNDNRGTDQEYTVTAEFKDTPLEEDLSFTIQKNLNGSLRGEGKLSRTFKIKPSAVGKEFPFTIAVTPDKMLGLDGLPDPAKMVRTINNKLRVYPAPDSTHVFTNLSLAQTASGARAGRFALIFFLGPQAPRAVEPVGKNTLEIELDSGTVQATCASAGIQIRCVYTELRRVITTLMARSRSPKVDSK